MKKVQYQEQLLKKMQQAERETLELSAFPCKISNDSYCMPPGTVDSIAEMPSQITPIPGAPSWVLGMAFVRGSYRVILDVGMYLKKEEPLTKSHKVLNLKGRMESLVVKLSNNAEAPLFDIEGLLKEQSEQIEQAFKEKNII